MWSQEAAEPDQRLAGALQQEPNEWDASACAHQDAAADAVHRELRPQREDGAEKWVGRVRDDRAQGALRRQLELPAAPLVERRELAPCTQVSDRFAELSCAEPGAVLSDAQ